MTTWEQKRDSSPLRGPLAPYDGLLRVTPGFPGTCQGRVHSVFHRVVNVEMQSEGDRRLLVLAAPQVPALPDSICLPPQLLPTFQVGQEVTLDGQLLSWQNTAVRLRTDSHFSGKLDRQEGQPCLKKLTACTTQLHSGFDRLPAPLRYRAEQALLEGRWQAFLGHGSHLYRHREVPSAAGRLVCDDRCKRPLPSFGAKGLFWGTAAGADPCALEESRRHSGSGAGLGGCRRVIRKRYDLWRPAGIGAWFSLLRPGPPLHVIMHPSPAIARNGDRSLRHGKTGRFGRAGLGCRRGQNRRNRKGLLLGSCCALAQGRKPSCHAGALWLLIFLFLHSLLLPEMCVASKAVSHKADKFIAALGLR